MKSPATRFARDFTALGFAHDLREIGAILRELRTGELAAAAWINFPILNRSGEAGDFTLSSFHGAGRFTGHAHRLPAISTIVERIAADGHTVKYARISTLAPGAVLRPHIDMYDASRMVVALSDRPELHRHVFGDVCVGMRSGEVWGIDGSICHTAANLADEGDRSVLMIDTEFPKSASGPFAEPWEIPAGARLGRAPWNDAARAAVFARARAAAERDQPLEAERLCLMIPFEHETTAQAAIDELHGFATMMANATLSPSRHRYWTRRADEIANPSLPCDVAPALCAERAVAVTA